MRDLESTLGDVARPSLLLGVFPEAEIRRALHRHGVDDALDRLGLTPWRLELHLEDAYAHRVVIACDAGTIVDTTVKRGRRTLDGLGAFEVLEIVWLELANPKAAFTPERPPLPGQRHPGLGLARQSLALEKALAKRLHCEALVTTPRWFHNASLYLRAGYRHLHASDAARFASLAAAHDGEPLSRASAAVEALSPPFAFGELLYPLSGRLRRRTPADPFLAMGG